jgi:hypothetical protein
LLKLLRQHSFSQVSHLEPQIPSSDELRDAIQFSQRIGKYLFLPFLIVFGACTTLMLLVMGDEWRATLGSRIFISYSGLTLFGFILWRISRKPGARLLFAIGSTLACLDIIWVGWIIYSISPDNDRLTGAMGWLRTLLGIAWAVTVFTGMGGASIKCFQLWSLLRRADSATLAEIHRISEQSGWLSPPSEFSMHLIH